MIALPDGITPDQAYAAGLALTDAEARIMRWDWATWARPQQMPPLGDDWRTWLLLGGRGSGKTRPCAEAVREWARDPNAVIALIGPTSADVRQVMIEGESGILNVCPPDERPRWQPSVRRLSFPSGAVAFTYSAEEPERLRGPQHSAAWCLTGDTSVLMADGSEKALRDVRCGDSVATRSGPNKVTAHALTRRNTEVFRLCTVGGRGIIGTSDHPVWVAGHGFVPLGDIQPGMSLLCASNVSSGMDSCGTGTERRDTGNEKSGCIGRFGNLSTGQFPTDATFTTSTAIHPITELKILCCSRTANTAAITYSTTSRRKHAPAESPRPWRRWRVSDRRMQSGPSSANIAAAGSGVGRFIRARFAASASTGCVPVHSKWNNALASGAAQAMRPPSARNCTVPKNATRVRWLIEPRAFSRVSSSVTDAVRDSPANDSTRDSALASVLSPFTQSDQVSTVRRLAICADVYDISTTGGEFFANGILVHNCDEIAAYPDPKAVWDLLLPGLRLGRNPRRIVSTTPKPLKFLHDLIADPGTRVSRQRTWDNRANLPDAYIAELQRIYGGTRIGRQELEGELLDEAEGALWRRARLDDLRVRTAPELVRVVVAIDPAVTSGENSDESGIVAAGMDAVGDGYVLADKSCRLPPDQWASRAISLFDALSGDRIIAETNNGGDLVESVLRTIRRSISYEKITASRGKVVRAEPVAALYEQGRVHHVGAFPELEDEMVNFVPGQLAKSPNRADALVWALSWLLLRPRSQGRALWVG